MTPVSLRFDKDHPAADGHFPGNPIIPGAVLLDAVLTTVGPGMPCEIRSAKFLRPVRPGDRVLIRWRASAGGDVKFECLLAESEQIVLSGTLRGTSPS